MRPFLLTLFWLVGSGVALAQGSPPFYTDDAATVSKRQWELDIGFSVERSRAGDHAWTAPSVDFAFGLTDALELDYGTSWLISHPIDEPSKGGLGNSVAGVKWRFFEDEGSGFSLSVNPQWEFNTRASSHRRGLVEKGSEFVLPFQVAKTFGGISAAFNIGRSFHSQARREDDSWLGGFAVGRKVMEKLHAGAELYGETSRRFKNGWVLLNVGAYYEVNDWLSLSASVGRGVAGEERPDYVAFFGVQMLR